jgi:cyclopropane-fatty-acyl-phospholipid synthase
MTSTQQEIDQSYSVSNEFFRLWLDEGMHYTSASYLTGDETLEEAQLNKCRILYDYAEMNPDKLVLDIGCGWGSNIEYLVSRGVKRAHGITLSTAQVEWIQQRKLPGVEVWLQYYKDF